ncbi:MAG: response regulator, partial [Deltaproteobacteria bacterium]
MTAHPSDGSVEASGRMTGQVLVVDDDALVCKLLEARLGKHGFRVAWTTSAETALQRLDADAVDAIVSDVSMTGMSGFELCERVAESHPDIPVVVMTAYGTLDTAIGAIRAG